MKRKLTRLQLRQLLLREIRLLNEGNAMNPLHENIKFDLEVEAIEKIMRLTQSKILRLMNAMTEQVNERLQKLEKQADAPTKSNDDLEMGRIPKFED